MKRFWAIWLTVALIMAPCAVVHAAHAPAAVADSAKVSYLHGQGDARIQLSGAAHHRHDQRHHGGDGPDNHDCVMNCQGWLSSSSSIAIDRAAVTNHNFVSVPLLFAAQNQYLLVSAGLDEADPPPRDHVSVPEPISIIDLTGRRRM